jgi:hypothetical protein
VISYISSRALDGSNNDGTAINLWSINSDCTGNAPLTMLTVDPNQGRNLDARKNLIHWN